MSLSRTLQENPWDKHLQIKVYKPKKDFNKLTRKKHRLYRNILINKIVESEKNNPNEFWTTIDTHNHGFSCNVLDNDIIVLYFSSHSMSIQGFLFLQTFLFFFFSGPTSLYETFKAALWRMSENVLMTKLTFSLLAFSFKLSSENYSL
jgi:hypothetical protein